MYGLKKNHNNLYLFKRKICSLTIKHFFYFQILYVKQTRCRILQIDYICKIIKHINKLDYQ